MNRSLRMLERERISGMRFTDSKDEDLALFREMRKCEKERNSLLLHNPNEFDAPAGTKAGSSPIFNLAAGAATPVQKTGADFFNSDNDKNDYDWLLTPPGTPLFPSLEVESQKTIMSQMGTPKTHSVSQRSKPQPAGRSNSLSRTQSSSPGLNSSTGGLRRPSSAGGPGSRPATPTGHSAMSSVSRPTLSSTSSKPALSAIARPSLSTPSKSTPTTVSKPSRSVTPTSRPTMSSTKFSIPPRSSTPTSRPPIRSSTPTSRSSIPAPKSIPRSSTPPRSVAAVSSSASVPAVKFPASSSVSKQPPAQVKNPVPARSMSPIVRPRPWKPSEMPGFSLDAPPNLRTSLPDRPSSVNRGRPGVPSSRSSSIEPISNGRIRRQSCSPARGRPPNGVIHSSGSSVPVSAVKRLQAKANDNVSPVLTGTRMVERMINMRKLAPPKQDYRNSPHSNISGKSSSPDSSGFGRTLSKKSLDMAIRHMDIRRTIPGNMRPIRPSLPVSSTHSGMRLGQSRKAGNVSDSPLATSSNASSEISYNNGLSLTGHEVDDDVSSGKGIPSSASLCGR